MVADQRGLGRPKPHRLCSLQAQATVLSRQAWIVETWAAEGQDEPLNINQSRTLIKNAARRRIRDKYKRLYRPSLASEFIRENPPSLAVKNSRPL